MSSCPNCEIAAACAGKKFDVETKIKSQGGKRGTKRPRPLRKANDATLFAYYETLPVPRKFMTKQVKQKRFCRLHLDEDEDCPIRLVRDADGQLLAIGRDISIVTGVCPTGVPGCIAKVPAALRRKVFVPRRPGARGQPQEVHALLFPAGVRALLGGVRGCGDRGAQFRRAFPLLEDMIARVEEQEAARAAAAASAGDTKRSQPQQRQEMALETKAAPPPPSSIAIITTAIETTTSSVAAPAQTEISTAATAADMFADGAIWSDSSTAGDRSSTDDADDSSFGAGHGGSSFLGLDFLSDSELDLDEDDADEPPRKRRRLAAQQPEQAPPRSPLTDPSTDPVFKASDD